MSTFAFDAICIAIEQPDGQFDLVGFADSDQVPKFYLMLQRTPEFDEQDTSLGINTYHVEWCDQSNSGYGGISQAMLTPAAIEFAFNTKGSEFLSGLETLKISLKLQPGQFAELTQALERIFQGSGCLVVADT